MVSSALARNLELNLLVHGVECTGKELGVELTRSWNLLVHGAECKNLLVHGVECTGEELGVELTRSWC